MKPQVLFKLKNLGYVTFSDVEEIDYFIKRLQEAKEELIYRNNIEKQNKDEYSKKKVKEEFDSLKEKLNIQYSYLVDEYNQLSKKDKEFAKPFLDIITLIYNVAIKK